MPRRQNQPHTQSASRHSNGIKTLGGWHPLIQDALERRALADRALVVVEKSTLCWSAQYGLNHHVALFHLLRPPSQHTAVQVTSKTAMRHGKGPVQHDPFDTNGILPWLLKS